MGHTSEDETGLLYMRARYCDPVVGRFVSEDPARDGGNWFLYCRSRPTCFVDRTGLALTSEEEGAAISLNEVLLDALGQNSAFAALRYIQRMVQDLERIQAVYEAAFLEGTSLAGLEMLLANVGRNQATLRVYKAAELIVRLWANAA